MKNVLARTHTIECIAHEARGKKRAWGMNPEEILTRQALSSPNAAFVESSVWENNQIQALSNALRDQMKREILGGERATKAL